MQQSYNAANKQIMLITTPLYKFQVTKVQADEKHEQKKNNKRVNS